MERGQSFREQSSRKPTPSLSEDSSVVNVGQSLPVASEDQADSARDFEKRLQYAMQQSLILQERQLKDIEILQEELGKEATGMSNLVVMSNKKAVIEKIRKPLRGILKKSAVRYVLTFKMDATKQYIGTMTTKYEDEDVVEKLTLTCAYRVWGQR